MSHNGATTLWRLNEGAEQPARLRGPEDMRDNDDASDATLSQRHQMYGTIATALELHATMTSPGNARLCARQDIARITARIADLEKQTHPIATNMADEARELV